VNWSVIHDRKNEFREQGNMEVTVADEKEAGPIADLAAARQLAVQVRRQLASTLTEGDRSVLSGTHRRQLVETQVAIEAIDRAIADEKELAKDAPKRLSKK